MKINYTILQIRITAEEEKVLNIHHNLGVLISKQPFNQDFKDLMIRFKSSIKVQEILKKYDKS